MSDTQILHLTSSASRKKALDIVKRQARTVNEDKDITKERIEMLLAFYQSRLHVIEFGIEWEQG